MILILIFLEASLITIVIPTIITAMLSLDPTGNNTCILGNAVETLANTVFNNPSNASEFLAIIHGIYEYQTVIRIEFDGSNDDILWWALAWARSYEVRADQGSMVFTI